jgi:tRNA modification GTPase
MLLTDTVVAVSSPTGGSGVRGIVRISGSGVLPVLQLLAPSEAWGKAGPGWRAGMSLNGLPKELCHGILLFRGPRSFTGEDVAELHLANSPALLRRVVDDFLEAGRRANIAVRQAGPGEFSARAFFNGKIDLTEAEGIAATINAESRIELRAAANLREGTLHKEIQCLTEKVANLLALVEAGIDFSDEEGVSFLKAEQVEDTLEQLREWMHDLVAHSLRVDRLAEPPTVVFIGLPNVGKSSLINSLSGQERAIVSDIAGTTRDVLSAHMSSPIGEIRLLDVPGEEAPTDELRAKMMETRARALLAADLVVEVIDHREDRAGRCSVSPDHDFLCEHIVVHNKADLLPDIPLDEGSWPPETGKPWGRISVKTGFQLEKLREVIIRLVRRHEPTGTAAIVLNDRHRLILKQLQRSFWQAAGIARDPETFHRHPELLAAELRLALDLLGQITGTISPDEVLGRIFSTFCIGK